MRGSSRRRFDKVPSETTSALQQILAQVEQELHLRRRDLEGALEPTEHALASYRRACEEQAAIEYTTSRGLKQPETAGISPESAARRLLAAVLALPQLKQERARLRQEGELHATLPTSAPPTSAPASSPAPQQKTEQREAAENPTVLPLAAALPKIAAACGAKKLIVVGALAGRKRNLPDPLDDATQWVDTEGGSVQALRDLPARIRQGRIFGLIICDQAIGHHQSQPLVAAARALRVPVGFAGKGGGAAIGRALKSIEQQLS